MRSLVSFSALIAIAFLTNSCAMFAKHGAGRVYQSGTASWYGEKFQGRPTASGERFDMHELTAAHRSLPFGQRILVTSLTTGKSVIVRINDRGPFHGQRILDVSFAAAKQLDLVRKGQDRVQIQLIKE